MSPPEGGAGWGVGWGLMGPAAAASSGIVCKRWLAGSSSTCKAARQQEGSQMGVTCSFLVRMRQEGRPTRHHDTPISTPGNI